MQVIYDICDNLPNALANSSNQAACQASQFKFHILSFEHEYSEPLKTYLATEMSQKKA